MKEAKRVLTIKQMYKADEVTIKNGVAGSILMENAGSGVVKEILQHYKKCPVLVLCGPGNNGGDGFVIARLLEEAGWPARVISMKPIDEYTGDALIAAQKWHGKIELITSIIDISDIKLVVDALFGVGLSSPLNSDIANLFDSLRDIDVIAVDISSGVNGDSGAVDSATLKADMTVTFCCKKSGHLLYPAREFCGDVKVIDIGIKPESYNNASPLLYENAPELWFDSLPKISLAGHKYHRGHAVVYGGKKMTGAACLAAHASMRAGAGLTTIMAPPEARNIYASYKPHIIVENMSVIEDMLLYIEDPRRNAVLIGPGAGVSRFLKEDICRVLSMSGHSVVLDADALSVFQNDPEELFVHLSDRCVFTPHEREFERIFGASNKNKLERALEAADKSGAVIILKGADTVIASPDGRAVINSNAPPWLATAGSGDVLAGMLTGLLAQNMPIFEASCAAVWLHGECANIFGIGLVADDIAEQLPKVLTKLYTQ